MMGIEPISQSWQDCILTIILHLHGISVAISGPARLSLTPCGNIFMLAYGTNYGEWCGMTDSNRRPPGCKPDALTSCANPANVVGQDTCLSAMISK